MTTRHAILALLSQGDQHGYDLKKAHDRRFAGSRPLAFGQLYAALERMQKAGHIEAAAVERVDGPERTIFSLTEEGRAELNEWLSEVVPPAEHFSNPLAQKATIALLVADEDTAKDFLRRQRASHLDKMRELTRTKVDFDLPVAATLAVDYAISQLDADLQWLESALERISALNKELSQ